MDPEIVYFVVVPLVLFFLKDLYFKNWNENKEKRERRKLWIATLCTDETVKNCIDRFDDLRKVHDTKANWYFTICTAFGIFVFVFVVVLVGSVDIELLKKAAYFNMLLLLPVFLFAYHTNKLEAKNEYTKEEAEYVALAYSSLYWVSYGYNVMVVSLVLMLASAIGSNEIIDYIGIISNCLFVFMLLALNYVLANSSQKAYGKHLMNVLNDEFKEKYPFVHVHTKDAELGGYIQDIFDEKLITLALGKQVTVFEWENIIILILGSQKELMFIDHLD